MGFIGDPDLWPIKKWLYPVILVMIIYVLWSAR